MLYGAWRKSAEARWGSGGSVHLPGSSRCTVGGWQWPSTRAVSYARGVVIGCASYAWSLARSGSDVRRRSTGGIPDRTTAAVTMPTCAPWLIFHLGAAASSEGGDSSDGGGNGGNGGDGWRWWWWWRVGSVGTRWWWNVEVGL